LKPLGLTGWSDWSLKPLVLGLEHQTSPVCAEYNHGACELGVECANFHMCETVDHYVDRSVKPRARARVDSGIGLDWDEGPSSSKKGATRCPLNHRVNLCVNKKRLLEANGLGDGDAFDEQRQLRARLLLGFSRVPDFATYEAFVGSKLARWGCGLRKYLAHPKKA
jgi:hypothetical protein